jgi:hypothetical protein
MKSISISLHPLATALNHAQVCTKGWLGKSNFTARNKNQKQFLELYEQLVLDSKLIDEMKTIAHTDPTAIADFISTGKGKSSKILKTDNEFSIGAMFEIFLKWVKKGEHCPLLFNGTKKVAASKSEEVAHHKGIIRLKAKNGDMAFMKIGEVNSELELYTKVLKLNEQCGSWGKNPELVIAHFPFIRLRKDSKLKWLSGLNLDGDGKTAHPGYQVVDCLAKNELDVDNEGARIKSAVMVTMLTKGRSVKPPIPKVVKIDKPFLFWVVRPGCSLPIFAAYCNTDVLVKP